MSNFENKFMPDLVESRIYTTLYAYNCYEQDLDKEPCLFDTKEDLIDFCKTNNIPLDSTLTSLDYIRFYKGKTDVVRMSNEFGIFKYITAYDEDGFLEFKAGIDSNNDGEWIYNSYDGQADQKLSKAIYDTFKQNGIVLENDVFGKVAQKYKRIVRIAR